MKQEEIAHARIRALAQIMVNKEKGPEVFEEYMKSAFPWIETVKRRTNAEQIKLLQEEVKRYGAIAIKGPLWQKKAIRSRLKTVEVEKGSSSRSTEDINKLYAKLGPVLPRRR